METTESDEQSYQIQVVTLSTGNRWFLADIPGQLLTRKRDRARTFDQSEASRWAEMLRRDTGGGVVVTLLITK